MSLKYHDAVCMACGEKWHFITVIKDKRGLIEDEKIIPNCPKCKCGVYSRTFKVL